MTVRHAVAIAWLIFVIFPSPQVVWAKDNAQHKFVSPDGDFELTYPDSFVLCKQSPKQSDRWEPDNLCNGSPPACADPFNASSDAVVACFSYLDGELRHTTFRTAALAVSVWVPSEAACTHNGPFEKIDGREFAVSKTGFVGTGNVQDSIDYRIFSQKRCYEFDLNINFSDQTGFDDPEFVKLPSKTDTEKLFAMLKRIVASFRSLKEPGQ